MQAGLNRKIERKSGKSARENGKTNKTQLQANDDDGDKHTGRREQHQPAAGCSGVYLSRVTATTAGAVRVNALTLRLSGLS